MYQLETKETFFYATDKITKNLINKARVSSYPKDKIFINIYKGLGDKKKLFVNEKMPLTSTFVEKKQDVDRFRGPFEVLQVDIADTGFLVKSAADPKYCLLSIDLLTSMIYMNPMKNRSVLARKMTLFYKDIKNKRYGRMRL